jgi:hypothetical protein
MRTPKLISVEENSEIKQQLIYINKDNEKHQKSIEILATKYKLIF